jgi:hypothetical protein
LETATAPGARKAGTTRRHYLAAGLHTIRVDVTEAPHCITLRVRVRDRGSLSRRTFSSARNEGERRAADALRRNQAVRARVADSADELSAQLVALACQFEGDPRPVRWCAADATSRGFAALTQLALGGEPADADRALLQRFYRKSWAPGAA